VLEGQPKPLLVEIRSTTRGRFAGKLKGGGNEVEDSDCPSPSLQPCTFEEAARVRLESDDCSHARHRHRTNGPRPLGENPSLGETVSRAAG
jgi:hypothetical protein